MAIPGGTVKPQTPEQRDIENLERNVETLTKGVELIRKTVLAVGDDLGNLEKLVLTMNETLADAFPNVQFKSEKSSEVESLKNDITTLGSIVANH